MLRHKLSMMETHATTKGRIVIPAALRRKYGIRPGTRILVFDNGENIILQPVTAQSLKRLQGILKDKGALKALIQERARDEKRER